MVESIDVGLVRMAMVLFVTTESKCWIWSSMTIWRLVWFAHLHNAIRRQTNRMSFMPGRIFLERDFITKINDLLNEIIR
jgi:hypothetical protein